MTTSATSVASRHRDYLQVRNLLRTQTIVSRRQRLFTNFLVFSRLLPPMQMPFFRLSHLFADCELAPEFLAQSHRKSCRPALHSDKRNRRQTDKLQILSWNLAPRRDRTRECWQAISTTRDTLSAYKKVQALTQTEFSCDLPSPLRRTPQQRHFHAQFLVHANPRPLLALVLLVPQGLHQVGVRVALLLSSAT